jgi:hypothetical protein
MEESWVKQYWRPAIAWQYFTVCIFDFIIFPLFDFSLGYYLKTDNNWDPITLKDGGFYHIAMAAIIGVSAWTRGQEKITKVLEGSVSIEEKTKTTLTPTGDK